MGTCSLSLKGAYTITTKSPRAYIAKLHGEIIETLRTMCWQHSLLLRYPLETLTGLPRWLLAPLWPGHRHGKISRSCWIEKKRETVLIDGILHRDGVKWKTGCITPSWTGEFNNGQLSAGHRYTYRGLPQIASPHGQVMLLIRSNYILTCKYYPFCLTSCPVHRSCQN